MSDERVCAAAGAGERIDVTVDGETRTYTLRPVVVQHLCDATKEALRDYKRAYLQTFRDNADLFGNGEGDTVLAREMARAARWTVKDLPHVDAYSTAHLPVTEAAREWARREHGVECEPGNEADDMRIRAMLVYALDNGTVSVDEVTEMCGKSPVRGRTRYDRWWTTATEDGMVCLVYSSLRRDHPGITRQQVATWPLPKLVEASRLVESISVVDLGNG